jgi:hypothetical protein
MKNGFILLSSYPKSGNTWVRAVLDSASRGGGAIDLNGTLRGIAIAASRHDFDRRMGLEASDLTEAEIVAARPLLWELLLRDKPDRSVIKVHDALPDPQGGATPVFPAGVIGAIVYVVRDPRDVAVSFAHHFGVSLDDAVTWMADATTTLDSIGRALPEHLPQTLSSWSRHVEGWLDAPGLNRHLMRYEDMCADPETSFGALLRFLGFDAAPELVARAVGAARFETLRRQEEATGFQERAVQMDRFFRRGVAGGWRDSLTPAQAERIVRDHGAAMRRLGYLR